jgi:hypothetical protein
MAKQRTVGILLVDYFDNYRLHLKGQAMVWEGPPLGKVRPPRNPVERAMCDAATAEFGFGTDDEQEPVQQTTGQSLGYEARPKPRVRRTPKSADAPS